MNWKEMPLVHKIATVIAGIAAVIGVIGMVKPDLAPVDLTTPAIAVFTLCEAVVYWSQKRKWAVAMIAAAFISMACFILELSLL
ncbi:MAG: hypothetical protein IKW01_02020 [Firmicutes bacterium]|nr:hypothetical protein [Bacillota bacterium]